jgi:hypothetical protein
MVRVIIAILLVHVLSAVGVLFAASRPPKKDLGARSEGQSETIAGAPR